MKVISVPSVKEWRERAMCRHCTTEVEVEASDLRHKVLDGDRPGEGPTDLFSWTCPTCGTHAYIRPPANIATILLAKPPFGPPMEGR